MYTDAEIQNGKQIKLSAWADFKIKYPNAEFNKFDVVVYYDDNIKAEVFFKNSNGVQTSVTGSFKRYWSDEMKKALAIDKFPIQLTLNSGAKPIHLGVHLGIPAVEFDKKPDASACATGNLFNEEIKIYVTPTDYFKTKFREIFTKTVISHRLG